MASRFRGERTVVPPVQITVRGRTIETTIGWNVNGADRALLGTDLRVVGDLGRSGPLPTERYLIPGTRVDFGGGSVAAMTSSGLGEFKRLLIATEARDREIRADIKKARIQHAVSWVARVLAWSTLVPIASRSIRAKADHAVAIRRNEVSILRGNLASSRISVSFDMETSVAEPHGRMLDAFSKLATCDGAWALQMSQMIDRVKARSMSSIVVARRVAYLACRSDPLVDTADPPPSLPIQNGRSTAYFYPGFVLVVDAGRSDFALIDLKELDVCHHSTNFTEDGSTPADGQMVGKVWAKSNKNGSRDRRFKNNRELPVMLYGELSLKAAGGLHEPFHFSRNEPCEAFARAISDLKRLLAGGAAPTLSQSTRTLLE
jgi:hypothetical protein